MRFENILADINGFGRFQITIIAISFLGRFTMPCHFMLNNFIAAVPSHHCDISSLDDGGIFRNLSQAEKLIVGVPVQEDGTPSSCQMFTEPQYHLLLDSSNVTDLPTVSCQNGWVYDHSTFKSTITSQWDLVCDRKSKNKATATIFFVGVMFGALTFGGLSDRFGRRIMLLVSYVFGTLFAVASAFSSSYVMFVVLRFFTGFSITGILVVSTAIRRHFTPREATMKFENILADINGFGRFQITIIAISFLGRFTMPCHFMLNNFIAAVPSHHCDISSLDDGGIFRNLSQAEKLIVGVPVQEDGTPSSCQMFTEPQYHLLLDSSNVTDLPTVSCQNGWVYDHSTFKSTITSQWDLVCDRKSKNKATATIFFVGVMFGALTFGGLSDRFGRRIMLLVSYVFGTLFAVASAFSSSYVMFVVLRFFTGFSITGIIIVSTAISVEWVDVEHRKLVGVVDSLSWTFGSAVFAAIGYFVTDWRWLVVSVTSPLIAAIVSWRWMPESARWLIANGKLEQAQMYLKRCATMNQREKQIHSLKTETLSTIVVTEKRDRTYSYIDLIRTPKMRKLVLSTGIVWFCVATTFYGISFNITGFKLNIYLTQFTYALIEVPAKLAIYYLLDKIGRRCTEVGSLLMAAICLGINILVPKDMSVVRTVVAVIGKGFSSASFSTIVLYSSELYPTVVRQNGMGYNSSMARLGVAVAPFILLLDDVWRDLPQVVLCSSAVLGALAARTLAETRNRCLAETIEDVEGQQ